MYGCSHNSQYKAEKQALSASSLCHPAGLASLFTRLTQERDAIRHKKAEREALPLLVVRLLTLCTRAIDRLSHAEPTGLRRTSSF